MNNAIQTAFILAGGSDLLPGNQTPDLPLALAPVENRPFLSFMLEQLASTEVRRVILCAGRHADRFRQMFRDAFQRLHLEYHPEPTPLGTAGAVFEAASACADDPVLVINGNSYCRFDVASLRRFHQSRRAAATLLVVPPPDPEQGRPIFRDTDGAVAADNLQSRSRLDSSRVISAGIHLLERRLLANIVSDRPLSLERDVFPQWIGRGLFAHRTAGPFIDLTSPHAYSHAKVFFAVERAA